MSNSVFQSVMLQLKDATDRVFGVVDAEGCVVSCTDTSFLGERWPEAILKVTGSAEPTATFGQKTFRAMASSTNYLEYAVFCAGDDEVAKSFCNIAYIALNDAKAFYEENYSRIDLAKAFYMATAGGGSAFGWFGKLEPGYHFNALVLDGLQDDGFELPLLECLERFCYAGDDRNITHRFIDGDLIDPDEVFSRISQL